MEHNPYQPPVPGAAWSAGPGMGGPPISPGGSYEFSPHENTTIASTGKRSTLWGIIALVGGVLLLGCMGLVFAVRGELVKEGLDPNWITIIVVAMAPFALVNLAIGGLYIGAGKALGAVVRTQGSDVEHMLQALDKLANAFRLEVIMSIVGVLLGFGLGFGLALTGTELAAESTEEPPAEVEVEEQPQEDAS